MFEFPWVDDFAAARNETLRHATGDWVFWLDADDRLDEENRARLRALFASLQDENAAYAMKCLCLPDRATGTATVVDHVRLFRNRPDDPLELPRPRADPARPIRKAGGEVRWSDATVHHAGYQDPALRSRKLERDLRLLNLEDAERPDDPFTLFNLGSVYHELGKPAEALPRLRRSLEKSHPKDSIVRKLYALIAGCHRLQNQADQALAACREGRRVYPDDPELLFLEGLLRRERGDLAGAEACLLQVLDSKPGPHFASIDAGLRGYKARHNLAVVYHQQGRAGDAEAQWRRVTAERPDFLPGWLGLGETRAEARRTGPCWRRRPGGWTACPAPGRWRRRCCAGAACWPGGSSRRRARCWRRRPHASRGELAPRVVLTHVLLQEAADPDAAERRCATCWRWTPATPRRGTTSTCCCRAGKSKRPTRPSRAGRPWPSSTRPPAAGPRTSTNTCRRCVRWRRSAATSPSSARAPASRPPPSCTPSRRGWSATTG